MGAIFPNPHNRMIDLKFSFVLCFFFPPLDTQDDKERIKKYGAFIRSLPGVNRATLAAIIEHLYRWVDSWTFLDISNMALNMSLFLKFKVLWLTVFMWLWNFTYLKNVFKMELVSLCNSDAFQINSIGEFLKWIRNNCVQHPQIHLEHKQEF